MYFTPHNSSLSSWRPCSPDYKSILCWRGGQRRREGTGRGDRRVSRLPPSVRPFASGWSVAVAGVAAAENGEYYRSMYRTKFPFLPPSLPPSLLSSPRPYRPLLVSPMVSAARRAAAVAEMVMKCFSVSCVSSSSSSSFVASFMLCLDGCRPVRPSALSLYSSSCESVRRV